VFLKLYIGINLRLPEIPEFVLGKPVSLAHRFPLPLAFFFKYVPAWFFHSNPLC
jgi:hypothetical protein